MYQRESQIRKRAKVLMKISWLLCEKAKKLESEADALESKRLEWEKTEIPVTVLAPSNQEKKSAKAKAAYQEALAIVERLKKEGARL